jgi:hypothetical protein
MPDVGAEDEKHADRDAATARARLALLRDSAAAAYAAITAADAVLCGLAEHRVAAEGVLRHAATGHHAASRAVTAHQRAKPGPLAQLATWFRAGREWRERQAELAAAVAGAELPLAGARRTLSQVKGEFTVQLNARAEAVAELRRLTAECAAVIEEIAGDRGRQGSIFPEQSVRGDAVPTDQDTGTSLP